MCTNQFHYKQHSRWVLAKIYFLTTAKMKLTIICRHQAFQKLGLQHHPLGQCAVTAANKASLRLAYSLLRKLTTNMLPQNTFHSHVQQQWSHKHTSYKPLFQVAGCRWDMDQDSHPSPNYHVPTVNTHNSCNPRCIRTETITTALQSAHNSIYCLPMKNKCTSELLTNE